MSIDHDRASRAGLTAGPTEPLGLRHLVPLASLLVLGGLALVPTVIGVQQAGGAGAPTLAEVAGGAHDPRWLPVQLPAVAPWFWYAAVLLAPFAAIGGTVVVGADVVAAVRARRPRRTVLPSALVLALCLAVLAELVALAPLVGWWLD